MLVQCHKTKRLGQSFKVFKWEDLSNTFQRTENNTQIQGKEKELDLLPPEVERVSHTLSIQQVPSMNCLRQSKAFERFRKKKTHEKSLRPKEKIMYLKLRERVFQLLLLGNE